MAENLNRERRDAAGPLADVRPPRRAHRCAATLLARVEARFLAGLATSGDTTAARTVGELDCAICAFAAETADALDGAALWRLACEERCMFLGEEPEPAADATSPAALLRWNLYCHLRRTAWSRLLTEVAVAKAAGPDGVAPR